MPDEWNPNAPNVGKEFQRTDDAQAPPEQGKPNEIVTKQGLEDLEAQRATPTPGQDLTMGGEVKTAVHQQVEMRREERIREMRARLNAASQQMQDDFDRSG